MSIHQILKNNELVNTKVGNINEIHKLRVLVVTEPRTGSMTIHHTIRNTLGSETSMHIHSDETLWIFFPILKTNSIGIKRLLEYRKAFKDNKDNKDNNIIFIYGYRGPVERCISIYYFLAIKRRKHKLPIDNHIWNINTEVVQSILHPDNNFDYDLHYDLRTYEFLINQWNIDILDLPFDKQKGVQVTELDDFTIIQYRLDKIRNIIPVLEELIGVPVELTQINIRRDQKYKELKERFKPTREFLDNVFEHYTKHMHHFLTDDEVKQYKEYWYDKIE